MSKRNVNMKSMKLEDMNPAEYNPRKIDNISKAGLASSIDEFGLVEPIIVNESTGNIVGGHQRYNKLIEEGTTETDVVIVSLTLEKEKILNITLNNSNITGTYDDKALQHMLKDISEDEEALFASLRLNELKLPNFGEDPPGLGKEDDVPDDVPPYTQKGDLYVMGDHRLLCGDSTNIEDVDLLMAGKKADMVFTDPPYRVSFEGQRLSNTTKQGEKTNNHKGANTKHDKIENDSLSEKDFLVFMQKVLNNIQDFNAGAWYVCFAYSELHLLLNSLVAVGLKWKNIIVWMKNQATLSNMDYKSRYEPIVYGQPGGKFYGDRYKQEDIWEFQRTLKNELHPTMKPIPLIENALNNSSKIDMSVLDLFGGSGSTLIACEKINRKCRMMEIDTKYCDVIVKRWEDYTGKKAELFRE